MEKNEEEKIKAREDKRMVKLEFCLQILSF
jgi:hypothetical protein